jgi:cell shape-determining protein MreC
MKKIILFLFAAALAVSFSACSNSKKEEKAPEVKQETPAKPQEAVAPVEKTPEEIVADFKKFVKDYEEALTNKATDAEKLSKLAGQMQQKIADLERLKIDFSDKLVKEYDEAKIALDKIVAKEKK